MVSAHTEHSRCSVVGAHIYIQSRANERMEEIKSPKYHAYSNHRVRVTLPCDSTAEYRYIFVRSAQPPTLSHLIDVVDKNTNKAKETTQIPYDVMLDDG